MDAAAVIPVSYTHLDVYKRQEENEYTRQLRQQLWPEAEMQKSLEIYGALKRTSLSGSMFRKRISIPGESPWKTSANGSCTVRKQNIWEPPR